MYISTRRHGELETLDVHIHMETWRHSMSISTWKLEDTPCPCILIETWRHTWRYGDSLWLYPDEEMETFYVQIHVEP